MRAVTHTAVGHDPLVYEWRREYPIFTLSSELTAEKFLNFVPVYAARAHPRGIESPKLLGQICRTWREIAFSTPQLWRAIDLDLDQTPLASTHILHLDILSTWLARSKHCPLSISLKYARYAKADLAPLIVEITRHVWRREHIELLLHNEDLRSVESDFPLLRSLTFGASDYVHEPGALDTISWFGAAPQLDGLLPWSQLTRLRADLFFTFKCAEILRLASVLVDFSTNMCDTDDELGALPSLKPLDRLQSLRLGNLKGCPCPIQTCLVDALTTLALQHLQIAEKLAIAGANTFPTIAALSSPVCICTFLVYCCHALSLIPLPIFRYWDPRTQESARTTPQTDSLQLDPPFIEESSEGVRRPSRLRAIKEMFRSFKQSKGPKTGRNITTAEGTPSPVALHSQPEPTGGDTKRPHQTGAGINIDNLVLAASIVESISNVIDKFPYVGPVAALLSQILKTCREIKDMREQRDLLVARLTKTAGDLHGTIMRMEANNHTDSTGRIKTDIEEYVRLLERASALMSDFDSQGRFRTTALQTEWASKFSALDRELDSFGARFNVNRLADIQIEQGVIHRKIDNGQIEQGVIHKKMDDGRTAVLKEKLEKWLKPADMSEKQHETQKLHHEGTGIWLLDGRQLTEWIAKPGCLWIEGNSGTGKSVISSTVIRKLLHERSPSDHRTAAVGYFYFDFRDDKKQLVDTMLRSVVFQLSGQSLNPYAALNSQYEKLSQGQTLPTTQELLNILDGLLLEFHSTYIVLDALDECRDTDLSWLVELLSKFQTWTERSLHLLFTSQPREIFTVAFKGVKRVVMESKTTQKDIECFVSSEVQSRLQRLKHWDHWKPRAAEIIAKVVEKSSGMFRLAACLLIELSRPKLNPSLDTILANLPNELYGIYDRFLETIDKDDCVYVERILRWLLFSARQLTLPQLEDALAFDFSDPHLHVYDPAKRGNNATILCGFLEGLVIVRESAISYTRGTSVVASLAHASVADYLVSDRFATKGRCNLNRAHSHTFLAQTCVGYLLHFENHPCHFEKPFSHLAKQTSLDHPLAKYAARYWSHHLLRCHDRAALSILTARLLVDGSRQYKTLNKLYSIEGWDSPLPPLYMCSLIGYREGVEYLLRNGADANAIGGWLGHALQAASANGHTDVIRALLKNGADINITGGKYGSALQAAAAGGHTEVVAAAARGHTEVVGILIKKGADVNTVGRYYRTGSALQAGAAYGHTDVVRLLIDGDANVNTIGVYYGSALQAASHKGHAEIIQILLKEGADVNAVGRKHGSALQAASKKGHLEIAQILRESGAVDAELAPNIKTKGSDVKAVGGRALQAASAEGHTHIIRLLLKNGADVSSSDGKHSSALQVASAGGHAEAVRILIKHGADINAVGGLYGRALQAVCTTGHRIRRRLDTKKMDVTSKMLLQGMVKRYTEIDRILRENGAVGG
ncbi:hypothetical protein C8J57DRAFT_1708816 [Mycena rebaudengoi]|nr:hypothetical protein C8J57DRAFT_1708816 [Mycena rebaudengoi]